MSEVEKELPLFFRPEAEEAPNQNNGAEKPEEMKWCDYLIDSTKPLNSRQRLVAELIAAGWTNKAIAEKINYNLVYVSQLRCSQKIKRAVDLIFARRFEAPIDERLKGLGTGAMDIIEEHLICPTTPAKEKVGDARWVVEKLSGKPAQQVNISGEVNLNMYLDKLDQMREAGQIIDTSARKILEAASTEDDDAPVDELADWVDGNL